MNCEKYKRTEALFTKIWTSLVASADTDHDGKISSAEWLLLWESYKKELVEREREPSLEMLAVSVLAGKLKWLWPC